MTFLTPAIREIAQRVRDMLESPDTVPIDLERELPLAYPVSVVKIPGLTIEKARGWFEQRWLAHSIPALPDRALFGCLIAREGFGYICLDNLAASTGEQRFTLAHEFSHF